MQHSAKSDMLIANLRFWKFDVETGWSPFMMKRTHRMRDRTAILDKHTSKGYRTGRDPRLNESGRRGDCLAVRTRLPGG